MDTLLQAPKWLLLTLVRGYRLLLSPWVGNVCRYYPSCSGYGLESMKVHGALKGTILTGWRLARCNPWNDGGIDPVPPAGRWIPDVDRLGNPRSETMGAHHSADTNV